MDDVEEERIIKEAIYSQMKFTYRIFSNPFVKSFLKPEILFLAFLIFILCFYLQFIELNASNFINHISNKLKFRTKSSFSLSTALIEHDDKLEQILDQSAVFR